VNVTKRDIEALSIISTFLDENRYAITTRELGAAMGVTSSSTTHERIVKLRKMGLLDFNDGERRTIHLTDTGHSALTIEQVFGIMGGDRNAPA